MEDLKQAVGKFFTTPRWKERVTAEHATLISEERVYARLTSSESSGCAKGKIYHVRVKIEELLQDVRHLS